MLGLVNKAIENFTIDTYGDPLWQSVVGQNRSFDPSYEPMLRYPDNLTFELCKAVADALERAEADVLEDLGTYLVSHKNGETLRRLLRFGGESYEEFLVSLDELNERSEIALSGLALPALRIQRHGGVLYHLLVAPDWPGFEAVMIGILRALADDYGALVWIDHIEAAHGMCRIEVKMLDASFSAGRQFALAGTWGVMMSVFDTICPCHAQLSQTGHILHLGPTLAKVLGGIPSLPIRFLEVFELRRPKPVTSMQKLFALAGQKLTFRLRDAPHTELKVVLALLPDGQGAVVNFSFGIAIQNAVQRHALTYSDFAGTDLAIEMLYLIEAKSAAMDASRILNQRLQGAKIAAEEQAFTDTLTGLKNRRALDLVLTRLSEAKVPFTVMQLDLDYFKAVNDTYGHAAGDHVLQVAARILVAETRAEDTVVRLGGDEFALVFYNVINPTRLAKLSQRIISRLEKPVPFQNNVCRISGSIGIALFDRTSDASPEVILEQSDQALYASKNAGRAQHSFFHRGAA